MLLSKNLRDVTMDNPQGTNIAEIAWLAGIIEGEGSLSLSAWNRSDSHASKNPKIAVTVKIYNTDAIIIRKCVEILNKIGIHPHLKEREQKPMLKLGGGEYKSVDPIITITVSKLSVALKLLQTIQPYLFGSKSARADLMVRYLEQRLAKIGLVGNHRKCLYDAHDFGFVKDFYRLTRRGTTSALDGLLNEQEQGQSMTA